ncbi:hypothetical protein TVVG_00013 [Tetraselmis viridis virus SI1]|uniref:tail length tape measure protein n=1 Tax=Tetraselmis viridis virus S20 TaxID=754070 RepID=UPI0002C05ED0|nr:tail length tape measure protein [Tetraselmis viridis virus S20]AGH31362.1 hypothetical protein TVGG_00034 [Tetraselmis viridis virus S20]AGH31396.1 hypothetical protein TVVG_00013 [Tetraselmis viridis virus SI1]
MSAVIGSLRAELEAEIAKFRDDMGKAAVAVEDFSRRTADSARHVDRINKKLKQTEDRADSVARKVQVMSRNFGTFASISITAPLVLFGRQAVQTATDAEELQSAFDHTFGEMQDSMNEWAEATGNAMGRSTQTIQRGAFAFGGLFNEAAETREEAAQLSQTFTILAQDLSSFFNVAEDDAIEKLRSGLSGEAEPLRRFNVFLTAAAVNSRAMALGLAESTSAITEQDKILARASLILEATTAAQGDVIRTSESAQNQNRALAASYEELSIKVGEQLIPALLPLIDLATQLLESFTALPPNVQESIVVAAGLAAAVGPLALGLSAVVTMVRGLSVALVAVIPLIQATGVSVGGLTKRLGAAAAVLGVFAAGWESDFLGMKSAVADLGVELGIMLARFRFGDEVEPHIAALREERRAAREAAEARREQAEANLAAIESGELLGDSGSDVLQTYEEMLALFGDGTGGLDEMSERAKQLRDQIDPLGAAVRQYAADLGILEENGMASADAIQVLARQAVNAAGGFETVLDSTSEVPASVRAMARALRDASQANDVARLESQAARFGDTLDRIAADNMPQMDRELAQVAQRFDQVRGSIMATIEDNRELASTNTEAARAIEFLEGQLVRLDEAQRVATASAQIQLDTQRQLNGLYADMDLSDMNAAAQGLQQARGDLGLMTANQQRMQDLEERLQQDRMQSLADLIRLEGEYAQARLIGDTEAMMRLAPILEAQQRYYDLVSETSATQIMNQRRLQTLVDNLQNTTERAVDDLLSGITGATDDFDFGSWASRFIQNIGQAIQSEWSSQITEGIFKMLGLGGREQNVDTINAGQIIGGAAGIPGMAGGAGAGGQLGGFISRVGSFLGSFGGFFSTGGTLKAGTWGIAGENGPEPIFGGRTGMTIRPNDQMAGAGGTNVYFNVTTPDADSFRESERQLVGQTKRLLNG